MAMGIEPEGDVPLVAGDIELVGDCRSLGREPAAMRAPRLDLGRGQLPLQVGDDLGVDRVSPGVLLLAGRERLRALRAVAVDRDRLQAELPALEVDRLDLVG